jgi:hypothetical protein
MGFSLLSSQRERNKKNTCYAGVLQKLYKKLPFRYDRVFQAIIYNKRKCDLMAYKRDDMARTK